METYEMDEENIDIFERKITERVRKRKKHVYRIFLFERNVVFKNLSCHSQKQSTCMCYTDILWERERKNTHKT